MSWRNWLGGSASKSSPASSEVDLRAQELKNLEHAMLSANMIMNDDIDGAEDRLRQGDSAFHDLGMGVCIFMRSILGFEKAIMAEASNRLNACETSAWNAMKKAQKESGSNTETVYQPGSEYALVMAEAQLMSAIVGVLHESVTEGVKGFYKLRKAFVTLNGIMESENAYLKKKGLLSNGSKDTVAPPQTTQTMPGGFGDDDDNDQNGEDTDLEFVDADEAHSGAQTPMNYEGHLAKDDVTNTEKKLSKLSLNSSDKSTDQRGQPEVKNKTTARSGFGSGLDSDLFDDPVDIFIHSGANMCFGVLLLLISMIPPAFSRLLSIVGFRGDREKGIQMLWQSSRFNNINGAVAGLMLLAYYNGLLGFADILPTEEDVERGAVVGYPQARCDALLANMRSRYPDSGLWKFEEARGRSNAKDLQAAIKILKSNTASKMRQVTALNSFELALDSMYVLNFADMHDSYLRCVELNDWSHALYYYLAGAAQLEMYRDAFHSEKKDEEKIQLHKKKAEELFKKAPTVAGKKRFMAKPFPFEQFVIRKLQKWEERSKILGIDLVDAVGVSPALEMVYLWNGIKKMQSQELQHLNQVLGWDRLTASNQASAKIQAGLDEKVVHEVCRAAIARSLGDLDNATEILDDVLKTDKATFKTAATVEEYALPAAHYEMAVIAWRELGKDTGNSNSGLDPHEADHEWSRKKLNECQSWLDKVAKWDAFLLDARIGMRVQTGMDTIGWYRREHAWATA
ncbi:breast cancer protein [Xylariomycetidae sp. FL2044]|nr:breast cancer protein [Xylariomycetidae sp. FL2044]